MQNGEEPFKNPRNTASGSLKLQDSKEVSKRPLECLLYSVEDSKMFNNHVEFLKNAKSYGFNIYKTYKHSTSLEEIFDFIETIDNNYSKVVLVGHNPAFTDISNYFYENKIFKFKKIKKESKGC